jgi:hypothetical protein
MRIGEGDRPFRSRQRLTNTHDRQCTACSRALDDGIAISVERRIGQMRVAIDERDHE